MCVCMRVHLRVCACVRLCENRRMCVRMCIGVCVCVCVCVSDGRTAEVWHRWGAVEQAAHVKGKMSLIGAI